MAQPETTTETIVKNRSAENVKLEPSCDTSVKSDKDSSPSTSSSADGFKESVISVSASRWKVSRARKRPRRASHRKSHSTPAALSQSTQRKVNLGRKKVTQKRMSNPTPPLTNQRSISYESFQRFQDGMYTSTYSMQVQPNPNGIPIGSAYPAMPSPFLPVAKYTPLHAQPMSTTQPVLINSSRNAGVQPSSHQNLDGVQGIEQQPTPTQHHVHAPGTMWTENPEYISSKPLNISPEDRKYYRTIEPRNAEWNENQDFSRAPVFDSDYVVSDCPDSSPKKKVATLGYGQKQSGMGDEKSQSNAREGKNRSHRKRRISRAIAALKDIMLEGGLPVSHCDQTSVIRTAVKYMHNLRATLDSVRCQYDSLAHQFAEANGTAVPLLKPLVGVETSLLGMGSVLAPISSSTYRRASARRRQQRHRMTQRRDNIPATLHDSDCSSQEGSKHISLSALVRQKYQKEDTYTRSDSGGATYFSKLNLKEDKDKHVHRGAADDHVQEYSVQNDEDDSSRRHEQECQNKGIQAVVCDNVEGDIGDVWDCIALDSFGFHETGDHFDDNHRSDGVLLSENELPETLGIDGLSCKQMDLPPLSFDDMQQQSQIMC